MRRWFALILVFVLFIAGCGTIQPKEVPEKPGASIETESGSEERTEESEESISTEETEAVEDLKSPGEQSEPKISKEEVLPEEGAYSSRDDVALYLKLYGRLPNNFITKNEARKLGWEGGSLEPFAEGKCIGGDWFGNYEELLPEKKGRDYHECDIDTLGKDSRGAKRLVYSNDGLIYYTEDHYQSFTLLYGEE